MKFLNDHNYRVVINSSNCFEYIYSVDQKLNPYLCRWYIQNSLDARQRPSSIFPNQRTTEFRRFLSPSNCYRGLLKEPHILSFPTTLSNLAMQNWMTSFSIHLFSIQSRSRRKFSAMKMENKLGSLSAIWVHFGHADLVASWPTSTHSTTYENNDRLKQIKVCISHLIAAPSVLTSGLMLVELLCCMKTALTEQIQKR